MRFTGHLLASAALLLLYPWFGVSTFIVIAASVLIDIDHIYLAMKQRAFTLKGIMKLDHDVYDIYGRDPANNLKDILYAFHTIEFNIVLLAIGAHYPILNLIALGFIFHIITDVIHHSRTGLPVLRWLSLIQFIRVNTDRR